MINAFPELFSLFRLDSFDQTLLDESINLINKIYPQKDKNKMAHSLLKLELLKYQMKGGRKRKVKWIDQIQNVSIQPNSDKVISAKNKSNNWRKFIGKCTNEVSKSIGVRSEFLMRMLKQNGANVILNQKLTYSELVLISDYLENRLSILDRLKKNKTNIRINRTKKSNLSSFKGVWGKMSKYGSPGKIIYIRSK